MSIFFIITFLAPLLVAAAFVALIIIVVIRAMGSHNAARMSDEEARLLQDLALSIEKMETRIGNLETIVIDRARKSEFEKL